MARRVLPVTAAILALAGAGLGVYLWTLGPRETPLDKEWAATVATIAGDGVAGVRDGAAGTARFSDPFGIAVGPDGTVYVADAGDAQRIRRIAPDGTVSTFAGGQAGFADGIGATAQLHTPSGVALDPAGALIVADTGNHAIRRVAPDGTVTTLAGDGVAGYRDGLANEARFNGPIGVAVDSGGRVLVADTYNDRIRAIRPDGTVVTVAGSGQPGFADGAAAGAQFDTPSGVAVDEALTIYVADTGNGAVRTISPEGQVTTLAAPGIGYPIAIASGADGAIYVAGDNRIVELRAGGQPRILAGSVPGYADGAGVDARFRAPSGIAVDGPARIIVSDATNALIRSVAAASRQVQMPASPLIRPAFDARAFAQRPLLWPFQPQEGPFEISGTMGESRGASGAERFHVGLDVAHPEGTRVHAVREGTVTQPIAITGFDTLYESMRVGPITYVHMRVGRDRAGRLLDLSRFVPTYDDTGKLVKLRVRRGAQFHTGDVVGTLNAFNHAHINVGWPREEHNPMHFRMPQLQDTIAPTIASVRLFTEDGQAVTRNRRGRYPLSGCPSIVVDAWDQMDGNRGYRRLGLYSLGYEVLHPDGRPALPEHPPTRTIVFDRASIEDQAPRMVFAPGSGIPFYGTARGTRFLYNLMTTYRNGVAVAGCWDVSAMPDGDYTLRVVAADMHGNVATANRDLRVTIGASGPQ